MSNETRNMELMQTLDDTWNAQDLETFEKRHRKDVVVRWPASRRPLGTKPAGKRPSISSGRSRISTS